MSVAAAGHVRERGVRGDFEIQAQCACPHMCVTSGFVGCTGDGVTRDGESTTTKQHL